MAKNTKKDEQNIDGVLEQLKQSYSSDVSISTEDIVKSESTVDDVSGDELQARLRSQFLNGEVQSVEDSDDYSIDEDFLKDAYIDDEAYNDDIEQNDDQGIEKNEENDYGFYEETVEDDEEDAFEEENEEETQNDQEASYYQGIEEEEFEEEIDEDYQEYEKVFIDEGSQTIQKEEYNESPQEIYEEEKDQEIQESDSESVSLNDPFDDVYFEDDEDYSLWNEEENYTPITVDDIEDYDDDEDAFEMAVDTRSAAEISEDNYVDVFYRENDTDSYANMSFKEKIAENAPTVDSLEAELNNGEEDDFSLEEFAEAESIPLVLEDDEAAAEDALKEESAEEISDPSIDELDRSDLALLLEFGYTQEVLRNVSDEKMESLSDDELMDDIPQENQDESDDFNRFDDDGGYLDESEDFAESDQDRTQKLKNKLNKQYDIYRKKRGGILLKFIISAVLALVVLIYELIPLFNADMGGIFNREEYFFAYVLVGLQLLIFTVVPVIKTVYESFKNILSVGIDAYCIAGVSVVVTVVYDFIVVFERKDIPSTFHFCAALTVVLAVLSELMRLTAEIRNYEYYFSEYIFEDDVTDVELYKYTLAKSEGKGSVAEKMYLGGLDDKTVVYLPQTVDSAGGFFESSKLYAKRSRKTFGWIIASVVTAIMFTVVSAIIYEELWVAVSAFLITFNLMLPIVAIITEWLPFERLSAQNYIYGAAFASEGSAESLEKCDMLVFNDLHIFEKCDAKSVNLAIYDSTSKAVLLSCLNSVYSEIGGPLQSAFSSVKVQSLGKCKINRVARSGVEAFVGSSYSVLIGDEQFMSRYGIFFPKAVLGKEGDEIFTLCVSINNRATARIAVKYKINETFYNILQKLLEDKIYCSVQTYDPMISAELVARVRPYKGAPVNIVHKSSADYALEKHQHKTGALYSVMSEELPVLARGSRLNLAVALSNAKKLRKLRLVLNICSIVLILAGGLTSLMLVLSERLTTVNWTFVLIYWLISGAVMAGLTVWKFPQKDRFIFNKK